MIVLWEILGLSMGAFGESVGTPPKPVSAQDAPISSVEYLPSLELEPKKSVADIKRKKRKPASKPKSP